MYAQIPNEGNNPNDSGDLVTQYSALVKRIAYHIMSRLPPSVQVDDLIQAGMIGLLEASRNYDAGQGASFETYAGIRIRGAMLDEIRKGDWAPRSVHRKARQVAEAVRQIENSTGRDARDVEVAEVGADHTLDDVAQLTIAIEPFGGHYVFDVGPEDRTPAGSILVW